MVCELKYMNMCPPIIEFATPLHVVQIEKQMEPTLQKTSMLTELYMIVIFRSL